MTIAPPALVPIFATPFAVVSIGAPAGFNAALAALFSSRATAQYREPSAPPDALCFRSREELFQWDNEDIAHLRREILGGVSEVVLAANRSTGKEADGLAVQARARFTIVRPNGALPAATAPMASWYAVYCVAAPSEVAARVDSAVLRLYAIRHASMYLDPSNYQLRDPFSAAHHVWWPVQGQMAVFPASVVHEVALNRAETDLVLVTARLRFADQATQASVPPW
jgi:hypothetical protein